MNGRWPDRFSRPLMVALAMAIATSSLLLAQVVEEKAGDAAGADSAKVAPAQPQATAAKADEAAGATKREERESGLAGGQHDFRFGRGRGRDLCRACHAPQNVEAPPPKLDRRPAKVQPLRPYKGMGVELDRWSLLCLGCHDGVSAPDVYSVSHATTLAGQLGSSRLGARGLRSHPVGIKYPPPDEQYHPRAAVEAAGLTLPDGRIQCATCHDPHNVHQQAGMLRMSNERSRMCLACHRR